MKANRDDKLTALAEIPLFAGCSQHELTQLARAFEMSWASSGEVLEMEGRRARWWKVIVHGSASVSQGDCPTGLLCAGDSWGEPSIVHGGLSSVTVVALTPVVLLTLSRRDFVELPRRHPVVATRIITRLVDRPASYEGFAVACSAKRSR